MKTEDTKIIVFAPDRWGSLERFQRLHQKTYKLDNESQHALSGAGNHFHRAHALFRVARSHIPKLKEDRHELESHGHTHALRGGELSAVVEAIILSLYSSIDCSRKIVTFIYKKERGVKESTRKFF